MTQKQLFLIVLVFVNCQNKKTESVNHLNSDTVIHLNDTISQSIDESGWLDDFNNFSQDSSIREFRLPFDNKEGIPFYEDQLGKMLGGFDVDDTGNLYFVGGPDGAILVKYKNSRCLYRNKLDSIGLSGFHHINDTIIVLFDRMFQRNHLHWIDNRNGEVISSFREIIENSINSHYFTDSTLILEAFNVTDRITMKTERGYSKFSLKGELLGAALNRYDVPMSIIRSGIDEDGVLDNHVFGVWKGYYLKLVVDLHSNYHLILVDGTGNIVYNKLIENRFSKPVLMTSNSDENVKLVSDAVYILMEDGNDVVVYMIDLNTFFGEV